MKTYKLIADNINGVCETDDFDNGDNQPEILSEQDFYDSLSTLARNDFIGSTVSEEIYQKIETEYGIK